MRRHVLLLAIATAGLCTGCGAVALAGLAAPSPSGNFPTAEMIAATALSAPASAEMSDLGDGDARAAMPEIDVAGRWRRAADGLFYVRARINGVPVRFLVDTGASVTVLTQQDAARVGAVTSGPVTTMATVGGATPMRWASVGQIALGAKTLAPVTVAIVAQPSDVAQRGGVSLLGQNVLRQMANVSIQGDNLTIG